MFTTPRSRSTIIISIVGQEQQNLQSQRARSVEFHVVVDAGSQSLCVAAACDPVAKDL